MSEFRTTIADLVGRTITAISGMETSSDSIDFECSDGSRFRMHHIQDCCESVSIEDIEGDSDDLLQGPVVLAEEVSSEDAPEPPSAQSYTRTFYRIATAKGFVVIRWLGESNGYYSESIDFHPH